MNLFRVPARYLAAAFLLSLITLSLFAGSERSVSAQETRTNSKSDLLAVPEEKPIRGMGWPSLSPDGKTLCFTYLGDLWTVPSAGGVAYARRSYPYLLNVPAARMSANSLDAAEFLRFARRSRPGVSAEDYLPRELYGEYLQASLASAETSAAPHVELKRLRGSVIALEQSHRDRVLEIHLADGRKVTADAAVLALASALGFGAVITTPSLAEEVSDL